MNTPSNKSGQHGASKPAHAAFKSGLEASMWAPQAEEKKTVGDRPYNFHEAATSEFKTGLEESMWAPANLRSRHAGQPASRAVPVKNPNARDEVRFLAEFNGLLAKYEFTPFEGAELVSKDVFGDVEKLSSK